MPLYFMFKTYKSLDFKHIVISVIYFIILFILYINYIKYNKLDIYSIYNHVDSKEYLDLSVYIKDRFGSIYQFIFWIFIALYINYIIITKKNISFLHFRLVQTYFLLY